MQYSSAMDIAQWNPDNLDRSDEIDPTDPRHGTLALYNNHGCRCPACRRARRDYARAWRARRAA